MGLSSRAHSSRRQAAVLLLVLLAHLGMMASPLHLMAMYAMLEASPGVEARAGGEPSAVPSVDCSGSSTTCMIQWMWPPVRRSLDLLTSPALVSGARILLDQTFSLGPSPQAHGPPQPTRLQALLQVFRI